MGRMFRSHPDGKKGFGKDDQVYGCEKDNRQHDTPTESHGLVIAGRVYNRNLP